MKRLDKELSGKIEIWYEEGSHLDLIIKDAWGKRPYSLTSKNLDKTDDWKIYCMKGRNEKTKVCFSKKLKALRDMSVGEFYKTN